MANEVCEECGTRCAVGAPRCPHCSSTRLVPEETLAGLLPSLTVCCANEACPARGVRRRVVLAQVVPGVLVLPRLACARCGFELLNVTEDIVPKITVHGGASDANAEPEPEAVEETAEAEDSGEAESSSPETSEAPTSKPARATASRSKKAQTAAAQDTE